MFVVGENKKRKKRKGNPCPPPLPPLQFCSLTLEYPLQPNHHWTALHPPSHKQPHIYFAAGSPFGRYKRRSSGEIKEKYLMRRQLRVRSFWMRTGEVFPYTTVQFVNSFSAFDLSLEKKNTSLHILGDSFGDDA